MNDVEPPKWTVDQHLDAGIHTIAQIEADRAHPLPEPVCHHFYEADPVDPVEVSVEATYSPFVDVFAAAGVEFLPDRLEAWETVKPQIEWLLKRIPCLLSAADKAGLVYQGWTWEPRDCHPIGASDIQIINNRTF